MRLGWIMAVMAALVTGEKGFTMQIETAVLDNGMKVVVVPDHRAPVVLHSVWYKVGSMDEHAPKTGLSHMLEHLMFKGTERYPFKKADLEVARNGGVQNAFTSREMTVYHQNIAKDKLGLMMDMEADRMMHLQLSDGVFQPERAVVAEERKMRTDSKPLPRFFEKLEHAHYGAHPYGVPVIGWASDIAGYTFQDALSWYKDHYAPNNATLMVVGDVELADILPLAKKYYAPLSSRPLKPREVVTEPVRQGEQRLIAVDKDVHVPVYHRIYRAPSFFAGIAGSKVGTQDAVALWVMAEVLGGSDTSRLYKNLVMDAQLADAASVSYEGVMVGESTVDVSVTPKHGVPLDKLEKAIDAEVAAFIQKGVTPDELARAKTSLLADEIYSRDDADNVFYRLGSWLMAGGTVEAFDDWQKDLKALTVADIQRVAKTYLVDDGSTVGMLAGNQKALGALKPTEGLSAR